MCGIAGLIHRRKTGDVGTEMTNMLKSLKHRGPDSTGFALYGAPKGQELVLRFKVAEQEEMRHGFKIRDQVRERRTEVNRRLEEMGARVDHEDDATDYLARLVRKALLTESYPVQEVLQITWNEQQWDGADDGEDPMSGTALDFDFHYLFDPEAEAED